MYVHMQMLECQNTDKMMNANNLFYYAYSYYRLYTENQNKFTQSCLVTNIILRTKQHKTLVRYTVDCILSPALPSYTRAIRDILEVDTQLGPAHGLAKSNPENGFRGRVGGTTGGNAVKSNVRRINISRHAQLSQYTHYKLDTA